jgi:hypothetical protein
MRRNLAWLVVAWSLAPPAPVAAQEIVTGGEASIRPSVTLSPRLEERILPLVRSEYRAITAVYGESVVLRASVRVRHDVPDRVSPDYTATSVSLDELRLSFTPAPRLSVDVGKYARPTGRALLLSPNNPFTTSTFESLVQGDLSAVGGSQTMVAVTSFLGPVSLGAVLVPAPVVPRVVEPGSIWTPRLPLDQVIDDPRISPDPVELGEVFSEPTRVVEEHYRRVSGGLEAGLSLGAFDLSLLYYHGIDPVPVPRARIDFPEAAPDSYDLIFAPQEAIVDSFGLVAEAAARDATFWLDAAWVPNRTLTTTRVDPYSKRTRLETAPTITAVGGVSYAFTAVDVRLVGEYYFSHSFLPDDVAADDVVFPPLSSDLLGLLRVRAGAASRWAIALGGIASLDDRSGVVSLSIAYEPTPALSAAIRAPVFLGAADTDFGQYRDVVHVVAEVIYRH